MEHFLLKSIAFMQIYKEQDLLSNRCYTIKYFITTLPTLQQFEPVFLLIC